MSWNDYVDKQLLASGCVSKGCIMGQDGHQWATSEGFVVSSDEVKKLVAGMENTELLTSGGVHIAGQRYIYLSGSDSIVRAKFGKIGLHVMKTKQALVIALYEDPIQPQQAASVVEKLGDYLVTCGY